MATGQVDNRGPVLVLVGLVMAAFIAVAAGLGDTPEETEPPPVVPSETSSEELEPRERDRKADQPPKPGKREKKDR